MKLPAGKALPEIQRQKDKLFIYLYMVLHWLLFSTCTSTKFILLANSSLDFAV